jgi:hypothetical protein
MSQQVRIEGYAIVSADGMLADFNRKMPDGLKIDADVRSLSKVSIAQHLSCTVATRMSNNRTRISADG